MTRRTRVVALGVVLAMMVAGAVSTASASAATDARPAAQARGMPWCGKTIWTSGLIKKKVLVGRYDKILAIADKIDSATDFASLVLTVISAGTVAVQTAVVKIVAKIGKGALKKVVKNLRGATLKIKNKKVGVRVKVGCVWGVVPYPSIGPYT